MENLLTAKSIRPFVGAKNFQEPKDFHQLLGCEEVPLGDKLSLFKWSETALFLLQDHYVQAWSENTMLMLEVKNIDSWLSRFRASEVASTFATAKLTDVVPQPWGKVFYLHDPSGNLWHFCQFED